MPPQRSKRELIGFFKENISQGNQELNPRKKRAVNYDGVKAERKFAAHLLEKFREKQKEREKLMEEIEGTSSQPTQENQEIAVIRKTNVFESDITEEEQDIINQRVAQQRKQYEEFEKREKIRKLEKIQFVHPYITEEEMIFALKECDNSEEEVCIFFTDISNIQEIRKRIAESSQGSNKSKDGQKSPGRNPKSPKKAKGPRKTKHKNGSEYVYRKLLLDDALAQGNFEGWSPARIEAYKKKDSNPNAYYYRFNDPGEKQKNGKWEKEEIELFFKRMEEVGVNGQWGIFSMVIPGRVGYQCSNFYRHLIETGQIKDPNYYLDDNGKAHYVFKNGKKGRKCQTEEKSEKKRGRKKRKGDDDEDEEDDDDDDEYRPSSSSLKRLNSEKSGNDDEEEDVGASNENPLPDFIDPITLCEVEKPAISPHGHVMGYANWSRCLQQEPRNTCPFTKKTVKKRDLVILTWDNIDEYRDKIVNWPDKQFDLFARRILVQ